MARKREEIEEERKWDRSSIFSSEKEWEEELEQLKKDIEEIENYRGELDSAEKLLEALELRNSLSRRLENVSVYASMWKHEDMRKEESKAAASRASALKSDFSSKTSFMKPEILEIGEQKVEEMMKKEEGLKEFRHWLEDLFRMKKHSLTAEEEDILSKLGEVTDTPGEVYSTFTNADLEFPEVERDGETVEITSANFTKLLKDQNREFRQEVHGKFFGRMNEFRNTIATTQEKAVKKNVRTAEIRKFSSAREAALKPKNIPETVHDNLVETVNEKLELLQRHAELKKSSIGVDELRPWDLYMPVAESEEPEISYEEAKKHVLEAVEPLGNDYVETARKGLNSGRWVDVYENKGKRAGAYSGGSYDSKPFIMMNYQGDVKSMFTLAHELGHSMHSHYTSENQPYQYGDYPIFLAEVASTTNEALLVEHLLETVEDENFRRHVLSHALENFRGTLFRQTMFAEFEHWMHRRAESGDALTPDMIDEKYGKLKQKFYPSIKADELIRKEWMRIPHFYYNYYVFQYSTGISAANALSRKILDKGPENYLEFLKSGSSRYPLETLKLAGVDMSSPEPVEEALEVYQDHLDRMEQLM